VPIDWNRALERAEELKDRGYSDDQVSAVLDQEAEAADRAAEQYGHQNAQTARSQLQGARGALNAEAAPPGQEPDTHPVDAAFQAADASGYKRGDENRVAAYVDGIFRAAEAGDPRVSHAGTIDDETRRRWHQDGLRRQLANRDAATRKWDRR
jgi:hypothetical protein